MIPRAAAIGVSLVLGACAGDGGTLKSLEQRKITVDKEAAPAATLEQTITGYRRFLESTPVNHPLYADAVMRLADLEMQSGAKKHYQEWEAQYVEAFKAMERGEERPKNEDFYQAIEMYEGLLESNPKDPRSDWILYQLARAYEQTGQLRRSLDALDRLVQRYPGSTYLPEAHFRRGEMYFQLQAFREAVHAYGIVEKNGPASPFYEKALYKRAWSLLKQEQYNEALVSFVHLFEALHLDEESEAGVNRGVAEEELRKDVLRGINLCLSYSGGAPAIKRFFARFGERDYAYTFYISLGDHYLAHDRMKDAADTYSAFIRRYPQHSQAPYLSLRRIEAYDKARLFSMAIEAKVRFLKDYGPASRFWVSQGGQARHELSPPVKKLIHELARYYHARGQKRGRRLDTETAIAWYQLYVDAFPEDPQAPHMHFLLAEALFGLQRYGEAADAYTAVAYRYGSHLEAAEAGYAALSAYEKMLAKDATDAARRRWVDAALRFVETFADDSRAVAVQTKAAERLFALKAFDQAASVAQQVLAQGDAVAVEQRRTALTVAGHAAFEGRDYMLAESSYQQAVRLAEPNSALRRSLEERLAAVIYKQAEARQEAGDAASAAQRFMRASALATTASVAAAAQYDAATSWLKAGNWQAAIQALETFRQSYPEHPLLEGALEKLAVSYERNGQLTHAAKAYESIAKTGADTEVRRQAAWQAAELYVRAGEKGSAIRAYKSYVYTHPAPYEQSMEARNRLAELYQDAGQAEKRGYWLRDMIKKERKAGARSTSRTRYLAANAAFSLAEQRDQSFRQAALTAPLKKAFKRKTRLMQSALDAYGDATDYGVAAVTTAATYRIAEIYRETAKALLTSERPRGLSGEEREQYDLLLEEQAYPFEEKAIQIHEANTRRAKDGLYDDWVRQSFAALSKLFPARFAKVERRDAAFEAIN